MRKKGQAAMEFLMTYGWAILAAIIAIGVLAYFGVFSPGKYVSGTAIVTPPFYVNAWNVDDSDGGVNLELKNNGGDSYTISAVSITSATVGGTTSTCTATATTPAILPAGVKGTVLIPCTGVTAGAGDNFKGDITITYRKADSTIDLTSTGTIAEKITA